ncbi:MAG: phosphatase PAP2 family protein [Oligoflexus sp.]
MLKVKLPLLPIGWKWPLSVVGALMYVGTYSFLGWFHWREASLLPLTPLDQEVPFLPWSIVIYLSDYLFILLLVHHLDSSERLSRASYALGLGAILTFAVFILFPTVFPRELRSMDPLWLPFFQLLYGIDSPSNCFPSLHVSMTLLGVGFFQTRTRIGSWGMRIWAFAICVSTLTTKQHYAIDVLGGLMIAGLVWNASKHWDYVDWLKRSADDVRGQAPLDEQQGGGPSSRTAS